MKNLTNKVIVNFLQVNNIFRIGPRWNIQPVMNNVKSVTPSKVSEIHRQLFSHAGAVGPAELWFAVRIPRTTIYLWTFSANS